MSIDNTNLEDFLSQYGDLSDSEKEALSKIMEEYSQGDQSQTLNQIWSNDFEEIPVDFQTFITDPEYLGDILKGNQLGGTSVYPYWQKVLNNIFAKDSVITEAIFTGGIGLGKSRNAITSLAYVTYKLMCLKDPEVYYGLTKGSIPEIAFCNVTLEQARSVGFKMLQEYCQNSPWFLKHGKVLGRTHPEYYPDKIRFNFGSKEDHFLGRDVFCLEGNTLILTETGYKKISELENTYTNIYALNNSNKLVLIKDLSIIKTKIVNELYEIELEDFTIIKCTGEHKFLLKDKTYKMAKDLNLDDELEDIII